MSKTVYKILALFTLLVFYGFYFWKMIAQKKRGITTNQMAKGKVKNKTYYTELLLKISTYTLLPVEVISILVVSSNLIQKVFGLYLAIIGDVVFAIAITAMRDSWRAGLADGDDQGRELVTGGIYRYSRNPAFLGFDLVYLGILIMYFNPVILVFTIFAMVMMHLQILSEEVFLEGVYKDSYLDYKKETCRYIGMGRITPYKALIYIYALLFIWSVMYFLTCLLYAGPMLSMIWMWPALAVFSAIRIKMLFAALNGKSKIPRVIKYIYRAVFFIGLLFFIWIETDIVGAMTADPVSELDYVIVLGAGLRGTVPTNPLRARLEKAYEYMSENQKTVLIASGGQGPGEDISEAQCIRDYLVEKGIDDSRIILEDKSTSTEENLFNSRQLIEDGTASVGILTNGFHEYRAGLIARDAGFENATSVSAVTLFPVGIHYTVREFFGVVWYMMFGGR